MVADVPVDQDQWADPRTIIFSYTPLEDPSVYVGVWDGFLKHMEQMTGRRVRFSRCNPTLPSWRRCALGGCMWRG